MCNTAMAAGGKTRFPSELALLIGLCNNSFAVALQAKGNLGLTTTSLLSFVLQKTFPALTLGTWSYLIQIMMIIVLSVCIRRVKIGYGLSFVLAILFGFLVDFFSWMVAPLPETLPLRFLYYIVAFGFVVIGISFFVSGRLPALPVDTFTRDLTAHLDVPFRKVRTPLDIGCFVLAVGIGLVSSRSLPGIGVGTLIGTFLTGGFVTRFRAWLDTRYYFAPAIPVLEKLIEDTPPATAAAPATAAPETQVQPSE